MTAVLEDIKPIVVDKWGTLNTAASPAKLPEGHSPNNLNVWMDEKPGSVVTANGYTKIGEIPSGNPPTLLLNFFKTSDGSSQLIVSDNQSVWWTTDYVNFTSIKTGLSGSFQLRGKVIRNKVWLTNGSDDVMTWDGSTLSTLNGSGGTPDVPIGKYIDYHDERVWIYGIVSDLSSCRFSALTDSSGTEIAPDNASAWPVDNEIQISEGDADQGTGIFLYRGYLYCSKQYSIWRIVGYDEYTYTRVKTRSSTGTRFQESIQIKDNLVHFIGVDGLYIFDGEESKRISDIIDPASPEDGVFAFRNLQQPLLNNQFWNVSETGDMDNGTVPNNIDVSDDEIALVPADDSADDFNSGAEKTNIDTATTPGTIALSRASSGASSQNIAAGRPVDMQVVSGSQVGSASNAVDESLSTLAGGSFPSGGGFVSWSVSLSGATYVTQVRVRGYRNSGVNGGYLDVFSGPSLSDHITPTSIDNGGSLTTLLGRTVCQVPAGVTPVDYTIVFSSILLSTLRLVIIPIGGGNQIIADLEINPTPYNASGKFVSTAIDYGQAPANFGTLFAGYAANGETVTFFTQSSADGSTWDAEVSVLNAGNIASTARRYLRWGAYLSSSTGANTPTIDKVFVGSTYLSEIHNTGGNILQWAAFQIDRVVMGQRVDAYFRAASTEAGISGEPWTAIAPGAVPNTAVTNVFIQIRIDLSTTSVTALPSVQGFTVNWILSSSSGAAVLQNVASFIWLNRYWLAAATLGATENDIVLVLGKSTFGSPWHKKDFKLLSFCRFLDIFIAGSSEDGSLYRLEYGFSKNGSAIDSFYETMDVSKEGFFIKGKEILVTADRSGPYSVSIGFSIDGGLTYTDKSVDLTRNSGDALSLSKRLNIGFMSDSVRFRVRTNGADTPFSVDELRCLYQLSPQRGSLT